MIQDLQQKYDVYRIYRRKKHDTGFAGFVAKIKQDLPQNMIQDLQQKHDTGFAASPEKEEVSVEKPVSARGVLFVLSYLTRAT